MSDLHCPATLLVTRHAEAAYGDPDRAGPADDGRLTPRGREQADALAEVLRPRRVAAVYTSVLLRAVQTGAVLGAALAVDSAELAGVEEYTVGPDADRPGADLIEPVFAQWLAGDHDARCPGGESAAEVIDRFRRALSGVADLHRGETVVVVSHGGAMSLALPRLCGNVPDELARAHWLPYCAVAKVDVDADGWFLDTWPGSTDPAVAESDPRR